MEEKLKFQALIQNRRSNRARIGISTVDREHVIEILSFYSTHKNTMRFGSFVSETHRREKNFPTMCTSVKSCPRIRLTNASIVSASSQRPDIYTSPRTKRLRELLNRPGLLLGPAAYDGISAKLTEVAGFDFGFMSGFCVAGGRLGMPDTGLLSYGEMVDQGRQMIEATQTIPLIGDGDTGYGNAINVQRTVQGYAAAGFSGILIEDQEWPKSCGHVKGKRVIGREEAIMRIKAACDARDAGQDIVIVARTDARQAVNFEEAMYRAQAFADAGADVVFVDALASEKEMRSFCVDIAGAHKMANMLEGGGKTPILSPEELEKMGFKLCAYPLSLFGVSINAMQSALCDLKNGNIPPHVPSFSSLQQTVGFPEYFEKEARYIISKPPVAERTRDETPSVVGDTITNMPQNRLAVDPDRIIVPDEEEETESSSRHYSEAEATYDVTEYGSNTSSENRRAKWLRIKISDIRTGEVSLDTRFPAGFLDAVASIVPQVAGLNLEEILDNKTRTNEPAFTFDADSERVDIFVEWK